MNAVLEKSIYHCLLRAAAYRVGKKRDSIADIARILYEHGARCAQCQTIIEDHVSAGIPAAVSDSVAIDAALARLRELHKCGYTEAEMLRKMSNGSRLGGRFDEVAECHSELIRLYAPMNQRFTQLEFAVEMWWSENEPLIRSHCRELAEWMATQSHEQRQAALGGMRGQP